MSSLRDHPGLSKKLGPITAGQTIAIVLAVFLSLLLLCVDGVSTIPLMWLVLAVILYMVPHVFGADLKTKATYPLIFAVLAIVIGAYAVGPAYINEHSSEHLTGNDLSVDITVTGNTITVNSTYSGTETRTSDPVLAYCEVNYIAFKSEKLSQKLDGFEKITLKDGKCSVELDSSKLYYMFVAYLNEDGKIDTNTMSHTTLSGFLSPEKTGHTLKGAVFSVVFILVIFYLILLVSTTMRRGLNNTRQKMEAEGRLYPQGYGRCTFCGALVLPGQINCPKCNAYIDRPESMKPHKKDYFVCGNCGCEVSSEMDTCPKCGVKFDEEENVVIHKDGTQEVNSDTGSSSEEDNKE